MTIEGVDLSHWDGKDYPKADFYVVRLGYSTTADDKAASHVRFARDNAIPVGGYWAMYSTHSGKDQAEACWAVMVDLHLQGSAVFCDAEQFSDDSGTLKPQDIKDFVNRMQALNGHCGVYSGAYAKSHGGSDFGANYTWLADYDSFSLPSGWTKAATVLWQYTSTNGTLDKDRYLGSATVADFFRSGGSPDMTKEQLDQLHAATAALAGVQDFLGNTPPPDTAALDRKQMYRALAKAAAAGGGTPGSHTHAASTTVDPS